MARELDQDELIDRWTLDADELALISGKRGATRLGFAVLLRFYTDRGRFPRGRSEIPDVAVEYVARQAGVPATEFAFYAWSGRTIEFHRGQIRRALGFRECGVVDADKLTEWLVVNVTQAERSPERVREELLARCREERIEPPSGGRIDRIVRSALHRGEELLFNEVATRLPEPVRARLLALVEAVDDGDDIEAEDGSVVLAAIRSDPGNVTFPDSVESVSSVRPAARERMRGLPLPLTRLYTYPGRVGNGYPCLRTFGINTEVARTMLAPVPPTNSPLRHLWTESPRAAARVCRSSKCGKITSNFATSITRVSAMIPIPHQRTESHEATGYFSASPFSDDLTPTWRLRHGEKGAGVGAVLAGHGDSITAVPLGREREPAVSLAPLC